MSAIMLHLTDVPALAAALAVDLLDGIQRAASRCLDGLRLACVGCAFLLAVPIFLMVGVVGVVYSLTFGAAGRLGLRDRGTGAGEAWAELFGLDAPPTPPVARQDAPAVEPIPEPVATPEVATATPEATTAMPEVAADPVDPRTDAEVLLDAHAMLDAIRELREWADAENERRYGRVAAQVAEIERAAFEPEPAALEVPTTSDAAGLHTMTVRPGGAHAGRRDYRKAKRPQAGRTYWRKDGGVWGEVRFQGEVAHGA